MYKTIGTFQPGYNEMTNRQGDTNMQMDIGVYLLKKGETISLQDADCETVVLPLVGSVKLSWEDSSVEVHREDVFLQSPHCLHVCKGIDVAIKAFEESEILIQKTDNNKLFASHLYMPEDCVSEEAGADVWNKTAYRTIRTIFDYSTAPYSNLVIGEVISHPGRWSSYPPHHHRQPEVYYYRFNKEQGFGCAMVGDEAFRVKHNSFLTIPGDLDHPQATAPGYAMYFCWMIRHLDNNPWTERLFEDEHKWLLEKNCRVWPEISS